MEKLPPLPENLPEDFKRRVEEFGAWQAEQTRSALEIKSLEGQKNKGESRKAREAGSALARKWKEGK